MEDTIFTVTYHAWFDDITSSKHSFPGISSRHPLCGTTMALLLAHGLWLLWLASAGDAFIHLVGTSRERVTRGCGSFRGVWTLYVSTSEDLLSTETA